VLEHADSWGVLNADFPMLKKGQRVMIASISHINITSCKQKPAKAGKQ